MGGCGTATVWKQNDVGIVVLKNTHFELLVKNFKTLNVRVETAYVNL